MGTTTFGQPADEAGCQITLGGSARIVTEFRFGYWTPVGTASAANVRFYGNDGPGGAPGTRLFESESFELVGSPLPTVKTLSSGLGQMPDTFIWTLAVDDPQVAAATILMMEGPPTIGSNGPMWTAFNERDINGDVIGVSWSPSDIPGLQARVTAAALGVDRSSCLALVASLEQRLLHGGPKVRVQEGEGITAQLAICYHQGYLSQTQYEGALRTLNAINKFPETPTRP
jgi:hypothetical protein